VKAKGIETDLAAKVNAETLSEKFRNKEELNIYFKPCSASSIFFLFP
jgi:hypothetical protein